MEEREDFVKDWTQVPDESLSDIFWTGEMARERSNPYYPTVDMSVTLLTRQEKMPLHVTPTRCVRRLRPFPLKPPYHIHNYPAFISSATGIEYG